MNWLLDNLGTIVVGLIVLAIIIWDIRYLIKGQKKGGCGDCAYSKCGGCPIHKAKSKMKKINV